MKMNVAAALISHPMAYLGLWGCWLCTHTNAVYIRSRHIHKELLLSRVQCY